MRSAKRIKLSESLEDYLESIYELSARGPARVRDIAAGLKVTMASASGAIKRLRQKGFIKPGRYDYIELTPEGEAIGSGMHKRHWALHDFLVQVLALDEKTAEKEACRIEHALSRKTIERLKTVNAFFHESPSLKKELTSKLQNIS